MTEVVLDASVVLKWFGPAKERGAREAHRLRDRYRSGELLVIVPGLCFLEMLNVAGRRWSWEEGALLELASALDALEFDVLEPELAGVASWTAKGLTAYDAAYVALADERGLELVTDDDRILGIAGEVARPLTARR